MQALYQMASAKAESLQSGRESGGAPGECGPVAWGPAAPVVWGVSPELALVSKEGARRLPGMDRLLSLGSCFLGLLPCFGVV